MFSTHFKELSFHLFVFLFVLQGNNEILTSGAFALSQHLHDEIILNHFIPKLFKHTLFNKKTNLSVCRDLCNHTDHHLLSHLQHFKLTDTKCSQDGTKVKVFPVFCIKTLTAVDQRCSISVLQKDNKSIIRNRNTEMSLWQTN